MTDHDEYRGIGRDLGSEGKGSEGTNTSPRPEESERARLNGWGSPEALVALYNTEAPDECPAVEKLTLARKKKATQYLAQFPEETFWRETFAQIKGSLFLRGLKTSPGHEHFKADFDWLLTKGKDGTENVVKVWEGKYTEERRP